MDNEKKWKCRKCGCELEEGKTVFEYLSLTFSHQLLKCPKCGQTLIPEDLAKGKMSDVETQLEDK